MEMMHPSWDLINFVLGVVRSKVYGPFQVGSNIFFWCFLMITIPGISLVGREEICDQIWLGLLLFHWLAEVGA